MTVPNRGGLEYWCGLQSFSEKELERVSNVGFVDSHAQSSAIITPRLNCSNRLFLILLLVKNNITRGIHVTGWLNGSLVIHQTFCVRQWWAKNFVDRRGVRIKKGAGLSRLAQELDSFLTMTHIFLKQQNPHSSCAAVPAFLAPFATFGLLAEPLIGGNLFWLPGHVNPSCLF